MSVSELFEFILEQTVSFFLGYFPSLLLSLSLAQIAWVVGGSLVALYVLWIGYVALAHIYRVHKKYGLTRSQKVLAAPLFVIMGIIDVVLNLTIANVIFSDIFREWTLSGRMARYVRKNDGYRARLSRYTRDNLLADFDPTGTHGVPGSADRD